MGIPIQRLKPDAMVLKNVGVPPETIIKKSGGNRDVWSVTILHE
jgi:hypothetical protein